MAGSSDKELNKKLLSIDANQVRQLTGSCLCGEVSYRIDGPARDVVNCYCSQCRKTSGHYVAATRVNKNDLSFISKDSLEWYECLPNIYRGFCKRCGGNLFWQNKDSNDDGISIMAGTLDSPTNLKTIGNIHTEDASDYCEIHEIKTTNSDKDTKV